MYREFIKRLAPLPVYDKNSRRCGIVAIMFAIPKIVSLQLHVILGRMIMYFIQVSLGSMSILLHI